MPLLAAHSIYKTYRLGRVDVPVLRGVNFSIEPGEWVAILGASGSGKSTLMHILGGLDRPDKPSASPIRCPVCHQESAYKTGSGSPCPHCGAPLALAGSVQFQDQRLEDLSTRDLDRYRVSSVGFVFQFYHLLPELTVLENVVIGGMIKHGAGFATSGASIRARASELLTSFGLGSRLSHRPSQLSGGERQRVAIARSLINDPPLLLADEPTGNLDRKTGRSILDALIEHQTKSRRAMVIVTHDLEVAQRATRIVYLEDGRIVPPPAEVGATNGPLEPAAAGVSTGAVAAGSTPTTPIQ